MYLTHRFRIFLCRFGGIIPVVAKDLHGKKISLVVEEAIQKSNIKDKVGQARN